MTFKTQSEYFTEMLAALRASVGTAVSAESEPALRLKALASELELLGAEGEWIFRQSFPQTADGAQLDLHAELRNLTRGRAAAASGVVRFYTDGAAERTIGAGTVLLTADGSRFVTTAAIVIPEGSTFGDAPAAAEETGKAGNIPAGAITAMALAPLGVTWCENPAAFDGGTDAESDSALRERLLASYKYLKGAANAAFYEAEALEVEGVAAVGVVPRANGRGTVTVYVASPEGVPSAELVAAVQAHLDAVREVSVDVTAAAAKPSGWTVRISLYYDAAEIENGDRALLEQKVTTLLEQKLMNGRRMGSAVHNYDFADAIMSGGIAGLRAVKVTQPETYYLCPVDTVPTFGSLLFDSRALTEDEI